MLSFMAIDLVPNICYSQREPESGPCTVPTSWYPGLIHTSLRGQVAN